MKVLSVSQLLEETSLTHLSSKFEDSSVDDLALRHVIEVNLPEHCYPRV